MEALKIIKTVSRGEGDSFPVERSITGAFKGGEYFDLLLNRSPENEEEGFGILEANGFYTGQ